MAAGVARARTGCGGAAHAARGAMPPAGGGRSQLAAGGGPRPLRGRACGAGGRPHGRALGGSPAGHVVCYALVIASERGTSGASVNGVGNITKRQVVALACAEALALAAACAYGAAVLPRHSGVAAAVYVAFVALALGLCAALWMVFVVRRPCWGSKRATPARLGAGVVAAALLAVFLEWGTLVGGPVSDPGVAGDWHASRVAAFFVLALPVACAGVMFPWRCRAQRLWGIARKDDFLLVRRFARWFAAAGLVGIVAGLAAGAAARAAGATWEVPYQVGAALLAGACVALAGLRRSMAKRPERGLLVLLAAAGVMLCAFTPLYTHVSWDDHIHYDRAVATSYLIDPEYTLGDAALVGRAYDDVARFAREPERAGWIDPFDVQRLQQHYARIDELGAATEGAVRLDGAVTLRGVGIVEYYTVAYIPAAVGLWTARLLALSTTQGFLLGRLATFACYALLAYFACKRLKSGKMVLAACAMVPTAVFLASGYSYDFWLIGFLMLGFSLFVGELQRPDEPLRWRWFLLMVAAFLLGLGPKAVYVPIAAMLLFMPRSKFAKPVGARRRRGGLRAGGAGAASAVAAGAQDARVCAGAPAGCLCAGGAAGGAAPGVAASAAPAAGVSPAAGAPWGTPALTHRRYLLVVFASALFVLATFVLPFFVAGPGEGDARGGAVNPGAQVAFILHDPAGYAGVFGRFLEGYVALRNAEFALTDFCGLETAHVERMVAVLLLAVALTDRRACDRLYATHAKRIAMAALALLTVLLIATALFISFTPGGADYIAGVQGRYLLPLLFPFFLFCCNFKPFGRLGERIDRTAYHYGVLSLSGALLFCSIGIVLMLRF